MDDPLLPRIAAGASAAVDECIARYGGLVWSLAKRRFRDPADVEDAVQEIFVDLWRSAGRFDPSAGSEVAFVATVARRRLIDRLRRQGREIETVPLAEAADASAPCTGRSAFPDRVELCDEAREAAKHLATLREEERRVLELSIFHGWSHAKISQETGLPLGSVKTHIRRGLISLREKLHAEPAPREEVHANSPPRGEVHADSSPRETLRTSSVREGGTS